jgi:hypothetical protein
VHSRPASPQESRQKAAGANLIRLSEIPLDERLRGRRPGDIRKRRRFDGPELASPGSSPGSSEDSSVAKPPAKSDCAVADKRATRESNISAVVVA